MFSRSKMKVGNCPKGSYHSYCRRKLEQQQREIYTYINQNQQNDDSIHVHRRKIQSMNTNRQLPNKTLSIKTARRNQTTSIQDRFPGMAFEQYLAQFQKSKQNHNNKQQPREMNKTTKQPKTYRSSSNKHHKQKQQQKNMKIDNEEIIDSHLPFFKVKLQKTEPLFKMGNRNDFRIKENKFKINHNVMQVHKLGGSVFIRTNNNNGYNQQYE